MLNDSKQPVSKTEKKQEDQSPSSSKPILATPEDSTKDVHAQRIGKLLQLQALVRCKTVMKVGKIVMTEVRVDRWHTSLRVIFKMTFSKEVLPDTRFSTRMMYALRGMGQGYNGGCSIVEDPIDKTFQKLWFIAQSIGRMAFGYH
ncbi:hypothetical protein Tco_1190358 [Tanacetum coccineum]